MRRKAIVGSLVLVLLAICLLVYYPPLTQPIHVKGISFHCPGSWKADLQTWAMERDPKFDVLGTIYVNDKKGRSKFEISMFYDPRPFSEILNERKKNSKKSDRHYEPLRLAGAIEAITYRESDLDSGRLHGGGNLFVVDPPAIFYRSVNLKTSPEVFGLIVCDLDGGPIGRWRDDLLCKRVLRTLRFE